MPTETPHEKSSGSRLLFIDNIRILLTITLMSAPLPAFVKFVIELPLAICGSFLIAHLIRAVPGIQQIL